jgi:hypothetical protein
MQDGVIDVRDNRKWLPVPCSFPDRFVDPKARQVECLVAQGKVLSGRLLPGHRPQQAVALRALVGVGCAGDGSGAPGGKRSKHGSSVQTPRIIGSF